MVTFCDIYGDANDLTRKVIVSSLRDIRSLSLSQNLELGNSTGSWLLSQTIVIQMQQLKVLQYGN